MEQTIITIGREYGRGGREIAKRLGQRLGITVYDKNMLDEMHNRYGFDKEVLSEHEESPVNVLFSRTVRGYSSSVEEIVAQRGFEFMREKADSGESFIMVGRCGEHVLRDYPCTRSFFILGDEQSKIRRIMERNGIGRKEAAERMARTDRQRRSYHNHYCDGRWGDSRYYDLCVNSSILGVEGTAELLCRYLDLCKGREG